MHRGSPRGVRGPSGDEKSPRKWFIWQLALYSDSELTQDEMGSWPGEAELGRALKKLGSSTSGKRVKAVADVALKHKEHYKMVVHMVEKFVKSSSSSSRLPSLYVIDAICREAKSRLGNRNPFPKRFGTNLQTTLEFLVDCSPDDLSNVLRTIQIWQSRRWFGDENDQFMLELLEKHGFDEDGKPKEKTNELLNAFSAAAPSAPKPKPKPAEAPAIEFDASAIADDFDYGDEDDEEERLAQQRRHLEDGWRRLQQEREEEARRQEQTNHQEELERQRAEREREEMERRLVEQKQLETQEDADPANHPGHVMSADQSDCPPEKIRVESTTLYVGHMPSGASEEDVRAMFTPFGKIADIRILPEGKGIFVKFMERTNAALARREMNGTVIGDSTLKIGWGKGVRIDRDDFDVRTGVGFLRKNARRDPNDNPPRREPSDNRRESLEFLNSLQQNEPVPPPAVRPWGSASPPSRPPRQMDRDRRSPPRGPRHPMQHEGPPRSVPHAPHHVPGAAVGGMHPDRLAMLSQPAGPPPPSRPAKRPFQPHERSGPPAPQRRRSRWE